MMNKMNYYYSLLEKINDIELSMDESEENELEKMYKELLKFYKDDSRDIANSLGFKNMFVRTMLYNEHRPIYNLSIIHYRKGEIEEAEFGFKLAADIILTNLYILNETKDSIEDDEEDDFTLDEMKDSFAKTIYNLAVVKLNKGEFKEAYRLFNLAEVNNVTGDKEMYQAGVKLSESSLINFLV